MGRRGAGRDRRRLPLHARTSRSFLIHISAPPRVSRYLADCAQYSDLRRILADSAKEHGASFIVDRAVSVKADRERPTVTLSSGTVLTADVVVGADGPVLEGYVCRDAIMEAIGQEDVFKPSGLQLFR